MRVAPGAANAVRRAERAAAFGVSAVLDALLDAVVVALALWTVLYHAALLLDPPTDALLAAWAVLLAGVGVWWRGRPAGSAGNQGPPAALPAALLVGAVVAAAAAGVLVAQGTGPAWWAGWGVAASTVVAGLVVTVRARRVPRPPERRQADRPVVRPWLAVLVAGALASRTLITFYIDTDDAFYVNKSVWVATHGAVTTRDTLFTDEGLGHISGAGVPVQSLETLQGAVAHLFGLAGPSVVYLVTPPALAALAVFALWRLVRFWAPRRANLAFLVGAAYVAVSLLGSWTMLRMWMGKAAFFALLLPLVYLYLSRWADGRRPRDAGLLLASGAVAVGLMSSATVLMVIIAGVAAAVLLAGAGVRAAAGALLVAAYPVATGLVVALAAPPGDPGGAFSTGRNAFASTFGTLAVAGIAWAAVVAAPALAGTTGGRLVALAGAAATVLVAFPPVAVAIDAATSSGPVLYRLLWVAPLPAAVGLLATVALPALPIWARWLHAVPAAALVAALLLTGTVYWARVPRVDAPVWKVDPVALGQARAIARLDPGPGPVLAPRTTMTAIGITTVDFHAVSPNASYVHRRVVPEGAADAQARLVLHRLMYGRPAAADVTAAPEALRRLDVSLVCLYPAQSAARDAAQQAGYVVDRGAAADLSCLERAPDGASSGNGDRSGTGG